MSEKQMIVEGRHDFTEEKNYTPPKSPEVLENLEKFRDKKLGLMMHWGPYSQMGVMESWPLCDTEESWSRREVDWTDDIKEFKTQYNKLNTTFNPFKFNPKEWARLAKKNGFKYFMITTKHHDGFCMFDSKYTNYKITDNSCPFSKNKNADVVKALYNAMRDEDIGISAYFSKPDWNCKDYWEDLYTYNDRGPTYNPTEKPDKWEKYVEYTHNQVMELVKNYGKIDCLWFDGGWVNRGNGQDIKIEELMEKARKVQPWLMAADRTVGGTCEDFVTPEQGIPEYALSIPWESCITMGRCFAYHYDDTYKSLRELIHLLIDVVCRGGNLALNVTPQPDGALPTEVIDRMNGIGDWLNQYGECIYNTRICAPYFYENIAFTKNRDVKYAIIKNTNPIKENEILIPFTEDFKEITCLNPDVYMEYEKKDNGILVRLPNISDNPIAYVLKIK